MRKKSWVALLVTIVVASDVVLANLPGPAPSSGVVADVEGSKSFQGVVGNATWNYFGYSETPYWSTRCIGGVFGSVFHHLDPLHQYTTTSLMFSVEPNISNILPGQEISVNELPFLLFVQVNPSSGQIYSVQNRTTCA